MHIHFLKEPAIDRKLQPLQREVHARANEEVLVCGQRRIQARHVAALERLCTCLVLAKAMIKYDACMYVYIMIIISPELLSHWLRLKGNGCFVYVFVFMSV